MNDLTETKIPSLAPHAFSQRCQALFDDIEKFTSQVEVGHADLLDPDRVAELKEAIQAKAKYLYHQRYNELQVEADNRRRVQRAKELA